MPRDKRLYMTFPNDFPNHPKIMLLSDAAFRCFVEMNGYSRVQDLDGRIPVVIANHLWKQKPLVELMNNHPERPSLSIEGADYVIRDYAEHQQTRAQRQQVAEKNAANGAKGGRPKKNPTETQSLSEQNPVGTRLETQTKAEIEIEIETELKTEKEGTPGGVLVATNSVRDDIMGLCVLLQELIVRNGSKKPTITTQWLTDARLLLDKDGRELEAAMRLLRWSQDDSFWRANILSMPTFRKQYDKLRLAENAGEASRKPTRTEQNLSVVAQYAAQEQKGISQ